MRKFFVIILTFMFLQIFTACGDNNSQPKESAVKSNIDLSNVEDGVYTAESSRDEKLGISKVTLTIENHKIVAAEFVGYDLFGEAKGEDYGSLTGKDSSDYKKAQIAVKANSDYAKQLLETQSLEKVDAISGATISYNQFVESVNEALGEASQ